jgi:hypothetical protein
MPQSSLAARRPGDSAGVNDEVAGIAPRFAPRFARPFAPRFAPRFARPFAPSASRGAKWLVRTPTSAPDSNDMWFSTGRG